MSELNRVIEEASNAYEDYRTKSIKERIELMQAVADSIEGLGDELIETAMQETNLPEARLRGEKARTVNQWRSYAQALESGVVLDVRIDTSKAKNSAIDGDIRKSMEPLGPVAIFGASNFPFAFSTAGGDTASAIAGGNAVIVKAHPGHPKTAEIMGNAIKSAVQAKGYPAALFSQVFGEIKIGEDLVSHPQIKAVGFTGSFYGGKALFDLANKRKEPIPVFSEMGSINPLFLLPEKLKNADASLAQEYINSLTMGTGQFCTNPGVLVVIKGEGYENFVNQAVEAAKKRAAENMLHDGIAKAYHQNSSKMTEHPAVNVIAAGLEGSSGQARTVLATTTAAEFVKDEELCGEVFGPFGLIVTCENLQEMEAVADSLEGQLTVTFLAEESELSQYQKLQRKVRAKCGRILFNGFPTGVAVCMAMHHGGPYPASTDGRYTSVGGDAIKRFMRPISYQNWPEGLLPEELKDANPLNIYRTINGEITKAKI